MLVSVVLLWLCVCFLVFGLRPRRRKDFPPGPPVLPVVGNLLHLSLENPLKDLEKLRTSFGDIYSLYIGPRPAVVLNGAKAIREGIVAKGADFAGRPQDMLVNVSTKRRGVIFANFGPTWKEHRRFAMMPLRNFGLGKTSMEERIYAELQYTIRTLEDSVGGTLCPQVMFHHAASNIICQVLFGQRFEYDANFMRVFVRCLTENTKLINGPWAMLYDSLPIIHNLPLPFRKVFKNFETAESLVARLVTEHKSSRVPGEPRDFVDCYLDELDKGLEETTFSEEELLAHVFDLYRAGTDTTSNTLLSGFLHLSNHLHIQERCQQEIDQVLEGKHQACFEDRHHMPYTQAVIHEVQRNANIAPLSVFHCALRDTELMGYSIPKGTLVIENLASALNEEGQWKFPHEFNPENFLNEQGEFVKPEAFLPFSAGPRVCLGEGLARMELFIIMVTLLRRFKFSWPEDAGPPDFTPVFGLTMTTRPYRVKVQLRSTQ